MNPNRKSAEEMQRDFMIVLHKMEQREGGIALEHQESFKQYQKLSKFGISLLRQIQELAALGMDNEEIREKLKESGVNLDDFVKELKEFSGWVKKKKTL